MARKRKAASSARKSTSARRKTTSSRKTSTAKRKTTSARKTSASKRGAAKRSTAKRSTAKRSTAKRGTAKRKSTAARRPLQLGSLRDVLLSQLRTLHDGERQLVAALPEVAAAATHPQLRDAVEHHLEETREHVRRLDTIFGRMNAQRSGGARDEVMTALVADAQRFIGARGDAASKDAALIAAAQKVEHHEIAGYGTARALADELALEEVRELLDETLDEESNADSLLTRIATGGLFSSGVNQAAAS